MVQKFGRMNERQTIPGVGTHVDTFMVSHTFVLKLSLKHTPLKGYQSFDVLEITGKLAYRVTF